jgi:hypothetical protein
MRRARSLMSIAAAATLSLAGCGSFIDNKAASSTLRILEKSTEAAQRQRDPELAREAMPGGILQLETFALAYPEHRGFRVMHAEAVCQYAVAFVFDDWEDATFTGRTDDAERLADRLTALLGSCVDAQLALLPPVWRSADARGPDAVTALLPGVTRDQAPHVLWLGTAGAVRIATSPLANLSTLSTVKAILARCAAVTPGLRGAEAEILLGTLDAALAGVFKDKPDGSGYFAQARTLAGEGALNVDVMFARGVAVAHKDRELFTRTLERVLATDVDRWPDRRLANALARKKAKRYLAAIDSLIAPQAAK